MEISKAAFIFPGQGAQYIGMGKDFAQNYVEARLAFEEADDLLKRNLSHLIWHGYEDELKATKNSQLAILITSYAILKVLKKNFPILVPTFTAGLSLGEYTALLASEKLSFQYTLDLVNKRSQFMNEACEVKKGTMLVLIGMNKEAVDTMVSEINLPQDLWIANYNCPGQIVLSGTLLGIETAMAVAKQYGAKKVLPLNVHGAFHSGLMQSAEDKLKPELMRAPFKETEIKLVMNYSAQVVTKNEEIVHQLAKQMTSSVRWEQSIRLMDKEGTALYLEIGPGKTLSGMNKRIEVHGQTINIEKIEDIAKLEEVL